MTGRTRREPTPVLRRLGASDTDRVLAVHQSVRASAIPGALDPRTRSEFAKVLADPRTAAAGAEIGGNLVGYAIYAQASEPSPLASGFLARFGAGGAAFVESRGIAVLPHHRKRGIGGQLVRFQWSLLHARGIEHAFNIVLQKNDIGIVARLASGAALVAHLTDPFGVCFLGYSGPLRAHFDAGAAQPVPLADLARQRELFARSFAVLSCHDDDSHGLMLMFAPQHP